jgi:tetratricopeptide (TPR) repeat protein
MKRMVIVLAVGVALVVVASWLFRGNDDPAAQARAAYERGDYATAVREYQRAAAECPDVGALAVNQAAALYGMEHYNEADGRYQFAESNGNDLRAAQAAYDRGNCALQQACKKDGTPDTELLDQAAAQYRACLERQTAVDEAGSLFGDARHNLEIIKLLQAPPPSQDVAKGGEPEKDDSQQTTQNDSKNGDPQDQTGDSEQASADASDPSQQGETLASLMARHEEEKDLCPD